MSPEQQWINTGEKRLVAKGSWSCPKTGNSHNNKGTKRSTMACVCVCVCSPPQWGGEHSFFHKTLNSPSSRDSSRLTQRGGWAVDLLLLFLTAAKRIVRTTLSSDCRAPLWSCQVGDVSFINGSMSLWDVFCLFTRRFHHITAFTYHLDF